MKVYQISYDLRKQRNYDALYERIKSYGTWCHALESTWLIATHQQAAQIRDYLSEAMDSDDGILVVRLQGAAAWAGLGDRKNAWIKQQLSSCAA